MRKGGAKWLLLSLFSVLLAAPAVAQFPAEVRGRVVDQQSGTAVVGAQVEVVGSGLRTLSGPDGGFELRGLVPGRRELRISAFGYREERVWVEAANGRSVRVAVSLAPAPVTITGVETTAVRARRAAGATVIGRTEIEESGARELGELLRDQPGVTVTRRGGPGAPAEVSIRGSSADEVLVLVDGTPMNTPLTGKADLSTVPLEAVERVTVLRGAQSARYGGRALAGVILVETRRPDGAELAGRVGLGAWGERSAALSAGTHGEARGWTLGGLVSGDWRSVEGDFLYAVPAVRGGGEAVRHNADASTWSVLATGTLARGGTEMRARITGLGVKRGMPGSIVQPSLDARQEQRRVSAGMAVEGEHAGVRWRADIDAQRQTASYRDLAPPFGGPYDDRVEVEAAGGSFSANRPWRAFTLAAGGEAHALRFRSTMLAEGAPEGQHTAAAWASARGSRALGSGWTAEAVPAVRADWSSLLETVAVSPRLALTVGNRWLGVRLAAGDAFSPPSLADQFFQEGVMARPNPDLRPERVRGEVEAGVELRGWEVGAARIDAGLAAYRADVEGMILWFPDHRFVWQPDNYDVHRSGWEASALARLPVAHAELRGNLSRTDVTYTGRVLDGQVVYRPQLTVNAAAAAERFGVRSELSVRYVGERRVVPGEGLIMLPSYWLADARVSRELRLGGWLGGATLAVENLLDRGAAMLIDYPFPGRTWSFGLRVRYEPRRAIPAGGLLP